MKTDVIIIGGGAAGLCAAVRLKSENRNLTVRVLERLPRVGKKLSITGNGRCNISNKDMDISHFHGENAEFCRCALQKYDVEFCKNFFEDIGVNYVFKEDKAYPSSLQASSVVDCLRFAAEDLGVIIHTDTKVTNIQILKNGYKVLADKLGFETKNVIIATGLYSGGEKYGCDGSMFSLLKKAGFKTVNTTPAIVQIKTENDITKQLKGIKINADASLKIGGKLIRKEYGEVLFCDYGLSGPPIMQISREVSRIDGAKTVTLDIMPETDYNQLVLQIAKRAKLMPERPLQEFFTGFINKRIGQVILKSAGYKLSEKAETLTQNGIKKIASKIKNMEFCVTGTTGFENSQVTAGGLDTKQFKGTTMESFEYKNLYAIGEILDIDGDCGGYNLQWAWSSAMAAADAVLGDK